MANLTITIDDQLLRDARVKAVQQGTSVNELCRKAIEQFARGDQDDVAQRMACLRAVAAKVKRSRGSDPLWPGREALHEEALLERGLVGAGKPPR